MAAILCALAAFFLSFRVSGALSVNLGASLLAYAAAMWFLLRGSGRRAAITIAGAACLLALVIAPTVMDTLHARSARPEPEDLVRRIGRVSISLQTVDPGTGLAGLAPLERIWQGVRVVALGEATRGTSEFFRMKHRLTELLVTRMGFRHIALELEERPARPIEEYIQGDRAINPVPALDWPWGTREMAAMVDWMRSYNASAPAAARVHFHGIDYQGERRDFRMAQNTLALLERLEPESRVILWAHNAHVSSGPGWMGSYLKNAMHNQIYLTGFEFHHGRFTSNLNWVRTYQAETADGRYYAAALQRIGPPILFLDFRTMEQDAAVEAWLREARFAHELQEPYGLLRLNPSWVRTNESWLSLFDGMVYIDESTPARLFQR